MVEVEDLFPEVEIFQQRRSARADLQRILVVGNRATLRRGQNRDLSRRGLMQFATFAAPELLIMVRSRPGGGAFGLRGPGHLRDSRI
jgi:hypothetical protein